MDWTDLWREQCKKPGEELEWTDYRVEERVHGEISRYLRAADCVDAQAELDNTELDTWKKEQLRSSRCTEVRYYNIILTYKSGLKMIKSVGVCEFSSDHAMEARSVLTVAYLRAHPPNLNSSNHLQLDQVLVFAIVCDHLDSANSGSALSMISVISIAALYFLFFSPKVHVYC